MLARAPLILAGGAGGVALASIAALMLGSPGSALGNLDRLQARLVAIRAPGADAHPGPAAATVSPSASLFGSGTSVALRLDGVAMSPGRRAALMSIDGRPADWLDVGSSRDGVTLVSVERGKAVVDTDSGVRDVPLAGDAPTPAAFGPPAAPLPMRALRPAPSPPIPPFRSPQPSIAGPSR